MCVPGVVAAFRRRVQLEMTNGMQGFAPKSWPMSSALPPGSHYNVDLPYEARINIVHLVPVPLAHSTTFAAFAAFMAWI